MFCPLRFFASRTSKLAKKAKPNKNFSLDQSIPDPWLFHSSMALSLEGQKEDAGGKQVGRKWRQRVKRKGVVKGYN